MLGSFVGGEGSKGAILVEFLTPHLHFKCQQFVKNLKQPCRASVFVLHRVETFYYNFAKIALISVKIGTHNLHMT